MSYGVGATTASSGAAAAAIAQAIRASGAIIRVEPHDFAAILLRAEAPLVVTAEGGFFSKNYQYLTSYKGLFFFTKSAMPMNLPAGAEVITTKRIWIP